VPVNFEIGVFQLLLVLGILKIYKF